MSRKALSILLVEDSADDALLIQHQLERGGYTPRMQRVDGEHALRAALTNDTWDIVITDHKLPAFDAIAALNLIKAHDPDLPVIIVSGSIGEELAVEAMKAGAQDYIMKNNLTRLTPAIERELREAETRRARRRAESAIQHLAFHDVLTGLVNRSEFERRLNRALATAKRDDTQHALLFLDLDQFKVVNDTCGHAAGDELLKQVAIILHEKIRGRDTLARLGGDEFAVLLENCPLEKARTIAGNLRKSVQAFRFVWENRVFSIGVSIGVVAIDHTSANTSELLSMADLACYTAKDQGRNCIQVYREGDEQLVKRLGEMNWASRIDTALEQGHFQLYCQPIESLAAQNARPHLELLLRLREHNEIITPGAFIPAAERYQRMLTLDRWVICEALRCLAAGCFEEHSIISINLSGQSLSHAPLFDFVNQCIRKYGIDAQRLCFEITETAAIANFHTAIDFIKNIKNIGCHCALDDFGSGLSSFSYLKFLPVDYLKIDGAFICNLAHDHMDRTIVEAINKIGRGIGIETIAEFVESREIISHLRDIGVDHAQGYAIARPRPVRGTATYQQHLARD